MATRMGLFVLMLLVAAAVAYAGEHDIRVVADVMDMDDEMMMESESTRRQLGDAGYISYMALARNRVPCDQPGTSYYNCRGHQRANPYNRGCTRATSCARTTR